MNNKLLAVAITSALVGPTAALADVIVYGQLHMSMDYTDSDQTKASLASNAKKTNVSISNNSSRIGFKGSEDLGNGIKAIWQVESQVNMEEGQGGKPVLDGDAAPKGMNTKSAGFGSRNTYVGLAGDFGSVLLGKHETPFRLFGLKFNPYSDTIADSRQILGNAGDFDLRAPNVIAYITPNFSGFNAVLAYVTGLTDQTADAALDARTSGADNNKLSAFSISADYTNGPIYAGLAYERHSIKELGGPDGKDPSALRIGGSYSFGPATIGGMWEQLQDIDMFDAKRNGWTLFGTYSFGLETIKLAYTAVGDLKSDASGDIPDSGANLLGLGIDHKFSKRTTAYAQYTALTNKEAAKYTLGGGAAGYGDSVATGIGRDPNAFSLGLIHKF